MELSEDLHCLFNAELRPAGDSYVIEVPTQEIDVGALKPNEVYRVALLSSTVKPDSETKDAGSTSQGPPEPPVDEGELREVEIEDIGEQGDGIARVERGYVIIVPDTEKGERVTIEVTDIQENVAFAEVVDRQSHV